MGDFPIQWDLVRNLIEGGQGHTFVVRRSGGSDLNLYVLKRLKNPKRAEYFEREIQACMTLDHPNTLKVLEHGTTPAGKPFLITEFCSEGSLDDMPAFTDPRAGLRFFQEIVAGVAHAHSHQPPIYHLDLKPANIFCRDGKPVVGDFGICFVDDGEFAMTSDGPRGSMYYCAPELRGPKIAGAAPISAGDVYSLGKVLYWLFTKEVYDGNEQEYGDNPYRHLAKRFPAHPQFEFIDDLVSKTVRWNPEERIHSMSSLSAQVERVAQRLDAGGRVLNLAVPQRCLYCAQGQYRQAGELIAASAYSGKTTLPSINERKAPSDPNRNPLQERPGIYDHVQAAAANILGIPRNRQAIPLLLICDHCGNVQFFRLDLTADRRGENWRP